MYQFAKRLFPSVYNVSGCQGQNSMVITLLPIGSGKSVTSGPALSGGQDPPDITHVLHRCILRAVRRQPQNIS